MIGTAEMQRGLMRMCRAQSYERSCTRIVVPLRLLVYLCGYAFFVASASSANSSADDISLSVDHGYVLIRITMNTRFKIAERDRIAFKNYDTGESFSIRIKTPYPAGVNTYLSLISVAKGAYFCDLFVPNYSMARRCPRQFRRIAISDDDIFEVKSGVVNYIGDWDVSKILSWTRSAESPEKDVTYDMATIEKSKAHFPEHLGKYEIYISYKGRKAISLNDLAELLKQHSGSDDE